MIAIGDPDRHNSFGFLSLTCNSFCFKLIYIFDVCDGYSIVQDEEMMTNSKNSFAQRTVQHGIVNEMNWNNKN